MTYRYQLEKYRGRGTRYTCPRCGRKHSFTRYIDTHNNNAYVADDVGKCNRIDKCGYHYTPREYFADNPWKREETGKPGGRKNIGKIRPSGSESRRKPPRSFIDTIPNDYVESILTRPIIPCHVQWLINTFGIESADYVRQLYDISATRDGRTIFWQRDYEGRVRTGKVMAYDTTTGHRLKDGHGIDWVHSLMQREGLLDNRWKLAQCLYGEHLLKDNPEGVVAIVEAYKTAHVGAILMPRFVWVATDSLQGLTAERLSRLRGRRVVLFPDEGKGYTLWTERIAEIAREVGFSYTVSEFTRLHQCCGSGEDIADLLPEAGECPF